MCENCPVKCGLPCIGEKNKEVCNKVNPNHIKYNSAYIQIVQDQSCGTSTYVNKGIDPSKISSSGEQRSFPSIWEMAKNLAGSMVDFTLSGFSLAPEEVYQERLSICQSCEFYVDKRCLKCGCQMDIKAKISAVECPIKKWLVYTPGNSGTNINSAPIITQSTKVDKKKELDTSTLTTSIITHPCNC